LSAIIDAKEEREVAVADTPNVFIQTKNEKLKSHNRKCNGLFWERSGKMYIKDHGRKMLLVERFKHNNEL